MSFSEAISIPADVRGALLTFAREIGDLDYVPTTHYRENPDRLRKGGGGPSLAEIPTRARRCLKIRDGSLKLMCDPVSGGPDKSSGPVRIVLDGREFYVTRPDLMVGFKVLHILESYALKPEKFNADFATMLGAITKLYSIEHLVQLAYSIVSQSDEATMRTMTQVWPDYKSKMPEYMEAVLAHPSLSPEIRAFLELVKQQDDRGIFTRIPEVQPEPSMEAAQPAPQVAEEAPPADKKEPIPVPQPPSDTTDIPPVW